MSFEETIKSYDHISLGNESKFTLTVDLARSTDLPAYTGSLSPELLYWDDKFRRQENYKGTKHKNELANFMKTVGEDTWPCALLLLQ